MYVSMGVFFLLSHFVNTGNAHFLYIPTRTSGFFSNGAAETHFFLILNGKYWSLVVQNKQWF